MYIMQLININYTKLTCLLQAILHALSNMIMNYSTLKYCSTSASV